MKKIIVSLLAITATAFAAGSGWLTDYDAALAKAKETKKPVLVVFSGSDWCPPCMRLEKETLSSTEFRTAMKDGKFVPLFVDFPRTKQLPVMQQKRNNALAEKFNVTSFPTVLLLDAEGKIIGRNPPRSPASAMLEWIAEKSK